MAAPVLLGPARVGVLLAALGGLVRPACGLLALPDGLVLFARVAVPRDRHDGRITDFTGDRIALDDRFFDLDSGSVDSRDVIDGQFAGAIRTGRAGFDREDGALWIDADGRSGPAEAATVAVLDGVDRLDAGDFLLF
jgi:hypothetical protein